MPTVIGVFNNRSQAERAVSEIRSEGISQEKISIVGRENNLRETGGTGGDYEMTGATMTDDNGGVTARATNDLTTGTLTGGAAGGAAGLLAGAGLLTIPGIGPLLALGPIVTGLTGAAAGGLTGALVDMGITPNRGKYFQGEVERGGIVAAVQCSQDVVSSVSNVLRRNNARDVETY